MADVDAPETRDSDAHERSKSSISTTPPRALDPNEKPTEDRQRDRDHGPDTSPPKDPDDDSKQRRRSFWIRTIFILALLVAAIAATIYWFAHRDLQSTDDAYTNGRAITIASKVAGYVVELNVNDNQFVHKGDVLIRIDPRDYQTARAHAAGALATAKGELAGAEAGLAKARITFPAALAAAQGQLAIAQGNLFKAQTDYNRQHNIARGATSQESIDASTAALQQAVGQVKQAEAQVQEATPVPENISQIQSQRDQLSGQVQQATADLAQADLNLGYTVVTAPQDGWVTRRNVEMGNYAQAGSTIMDLVSPDIWVTANFKETELDRIRPGQKVSISVDGYPGLELNGHIDSTQLGSGSRFSAFPAENATGNFVKIVQRVPVKIVIDSGLNPNILLPLGISVVPTVHLGDTKQAGK